MELRHIPSWQRRRLFASAGLLLLMLWVTALPAQTVPCEAVDRNDQPRNCTFTEKYGQCLWEAGEAHEQCWEEADGGFDRMACDLAWVVDGMACHIEAPFTLLKGLPSVIVED